MLNYKLQYNDNFLDVTLTINNYVLFSMGVWDNHILYHRTNNNVFINIKNNVNLFNNISFIEEIEYQLNNGIDKDNLIVNIPSKGLGVIKNRIRNKKLQQIFR